MAQLTTQISISKVSDQVLQVWVNYLQMITGSQRVTRSDQVPCSKRALVDRLIMECAAIESMQHPRLREMLLEYAIGSKPYIDRELARRQESEAQQEPLGQEQEQNAGGSEQTG